MMSEIEKNNVCPIEHTLKLIGVKWKLIILLYLNDKGIMRYGELKKELPNITHKMLSQQLKELQSNNFINRTEYLQIPPKVEYSLTEHGKSVIPVIDSISNWGSENMFL